MLKNAVEVYRYASVDLDVDNSVVEKFIKPLELMYVKDLLGVGLYNNLINGLDKPEYKELKSECKEYLAHLVLWYTSIFYSEDVELQQHLKRSLLYSKLHLEKFLETAKFELYRKQQYIIP